MKGEISLKVTNLITKIRDNVTNTKVVTVGSGMTIISVNEDSKVESHLWMSNVGEYINIRKVWDLELGRPVRHLLVLPSQGTRLLKDK